MGDAPETEDRENLIMNKRNQCLIEIRRMIESDFHDGINDRYIILKRLGGELEEITNAADTEKYTSNNISDALRRLGYGTTPLSQSNQRSISGVKTSIWRTTDRSKWLSYEAIQDIHKHDAEIDGDDKSAEELRKEKEFKIASYTREF